MDRAATDPRLILGRRLSEEPTNRRRRERKYVELAVALAVALALAGCGGGRAKSSSNGSASNSATPVGVTASQLYAVAASAGHPIYWAGTATGTYELTQIADGRTYIRYLPPGIAAGSTREYLTIGTYVVKSAPYDAVHTAAIAKHAVIKPVNKAGALAVQYQTRPQSVYMVFPGVDYEVEVFDPSPAVALRLATTGKVVPIP